LSLHKGVHEVEVDFNSRQASVIFDKASVAIGQLTQSVTDAGYRVVGVTQNAADLTT
jgi:copper chaperone CopZ